MSRVLVVEDEAHLAKGLRFNLQAEGHEVEVSGDGEDALSRLVDRAERFDAVVLDVMLPGKSGFEVAALLREKKNYVPILMLTARGRSGGRLAGIRCGADDYLPKPFELAILIARLDGLLRRSVWMKQSATSAAGNDPTIDSERSIGNPGTQRTRFSLPVNPSISVNSNSAAWAILFTSPSWKRNSYATWCTARGAWFRARFCLKKSGDCTKTLIRAPSIILLCACGATSRKIRRVPSTCKR